MLLPTSLFSFSFLLILGRKYSILRPLKYQNDILLKRVSDEMIFNFFLK